MRPGVLECGCLWDGKVLLVRCGVDPEDHGLGRVPFVRPSLSIGGIPLDEVVWPVVSTPPVEQDRRFNWTPPLPDEWPDAAGPWITGWER